MRTVRLMILVSLMSLSLVLSAQAQTSLPLWPIEQYSLQTFDYPWHGEFGATILEDVASTQATLVSLTDTGTYETYLRTLAGALTLIPCPPTSDPTRTRVTSLNRHNQMAMTCHVTATRQGKAMIVRPDAGGFVYNIVRPPQGAQPVATGLSDPGHLVGWYRDVEGKGPYGFLWYKNVFTTIVVPFPEATGTMLTGVNGRGTMVGVYFTADGFHGVRFTAGVAERLDLPGASSTFPADINDAGVIVGIAHAPDGTPAWMYTEGAFQEVQLPDPQVSVDLNGINNQGQLAGRTIRLNPDPMKIELTQGFLATPLPPSLFPPVASQTQALMAATMATSRAGMDQGADTPTRPKLRLVLDQCAAREPGTLLPTKLAGVFPGCESGR